MVAVNCLAILILVDLSLSLTSTTPEYDPYQNYDEFPDAEGELLFRKPKHNVKIDARPSDSKLGRAHHIFDLASASGLPQKISLPKIDDAAPKKEWGISLPEYCKDTGANCSVIDSRLKRVSRR